MAAFLLPTTTGMTGTIGTNATTSMIAMTGTIAMTGMTVKVHAAIGKTYGWVTQTRHG